MSRSLLLISLLWEAGSYNELLQKMFRYHATVSTCQPFLRVRVGMDVCVISGGIEVMDFFLVYERRKKKLFVDLFFFIREHIHYYHDFFFSVVQLVFLWF